VHQEEGAKIISEFLRDNEYDEDGIQRVYKMVNHHEEGGDEESDLIKDADSLSYFETNAMKHAQEMPKKLGERKVRRKIEWMYSRITSDKAKEIAKQSYEAALRLLESSVI